MKRRGIVVEFFGLPSVGKTTLAEQASDALRQRGFDVDRPNKPRDPSMVSSQRYRDLPRKLDRLLGLAGFVLCRPGFALRSTRQVLASRQSSWKDLRLVLFRWLYMSSVNRRYRRRPGVHLVDQGLIQALWGIGFSAEKGDVAPIVAALGPAMPLPDLLVVVEAGRERLEQRLAARADGISRLERRLPNAPDLWDRAFGLHEQVRNAAVALAAERGSMRVVVIDNDRDDALEAKTSAIVHGAVEILGGEPAPALT